MNEWKLLHPQTRTFPNRLHITICRLFCVKPLSESIFANRLFINYKCRMICDRVRYRVKAIKNLWTINNELRSHQFKKADITIAQWASRVSTWISISKEMYLNIAYVKMNVLLETMHAWWRRNVRRMWTRHARKQDLPKGTFPKFKRLTNSI